MCLLLFVYDVLESKEDFLDSVVFALWMVSMLARGGEDFFLFRSSKARAEIRSSAFLPLDMSVFVCGGC